MVFFVAPRVEAAFFTDVGLGLHVVRNPFRNRFRFPRLAIGHHGDIRLAVVARVVQLDAARRQQAFDGDRRMQEGPVAARRPPFASAHLKTRIDEREVGAGLG